MLKSGLVWRMALRNLGKQWQQTLLTVIAGSIGAMLIAISAVNYESVNRSGADWIETRLGPIEWKLKPENQGTAGFSKAEVEKLMDYTTSTATGYSLLPYVGAEAAILYNKAGKSDTAAIGHTLLLGFSLEAAAQLEPDRADMWKGGLRDDEVILNRSTADHLQAALGDTITVKTVGGQKLLRVRVITEQRGLTGYADTGNYSDTIIGTEQTVRELSGKQDERYEAILAGPRSGLPKPEGMFLLPDIPFQVEYLKSDYITKIHNMNYTFIIAMISAVAVISSMIFMRQTLVMIGESRQALYGILRAIGFSVNSLTSMFLVEGVLISLSSALIGSVIGSAGGYWLIRAFYGASGEVLNRMNGDSFPIHPHLSFGTIGMVFGLTLLFLVVISIMAARKISRFPVVQALRASSSGTDSRKRKKSLLWKIAMGGGITAVCIHLSIAYGQTSELTSGKLLIITVTWLISCCTVLYFGLMALRRYDRLLKKLLRWLGIPSLSLMLAVRYPKRHGGRTYSTALLFALVMMTITFIISIMQLLLASGDVERTNQKVIGFGGYASYQSLAEKSRIESASTDDDFLRSHIKRTLAVEPYMLNVVRNGSAQAIIPVTNELIKDGQLKLLARSSEFKSDDEAWRAVLLNPQYIILPHYYTIKDPLADEAIEQIQAGDTITLPIYDHKPRRADEEPKPVAQKTFTVAGFAVSDSYIHLIDFYGATYVNETVAKELKPYGYKWSNQKSLGFVLYDMDYKDAKLTRAMEERFAIHGVMSFTIPYAVNASKQIMNQQIGYGFVGFTVLSAVIGLLGLVIIQFRSVRERGKQVAMLRCIGVSGKSIYWMFVLEGFFISSVGLIAGWVIGSTGSRIFVQSLSTDIREFEKPLDLSYPYQAIIPILMGLIVISFLINIVPARASLKLKAADALRIAGE